MGSQVGPDVDAEQPPAVPIVVSRLTKKYGDRYAVQDVSFTVRPGRVTGFLGPNGAGKTTTLRILLGLSQPTSGTAQFGRRTFRDLVNPKRTVGASLDSGGFHPGRSGRNHLSLHAMACKATRSRVEELLELVGLTDAASKNVGTYSLGMRQRLALAEALLADPAVLVLDEPTNGLDPAGIAWLRQFLRFQANLGRTVLISSHLLHEIVHLVDDVVVIDHGKLLRASSLADWQSEAIRSVRVRSTNAEALVAELERHGIGSIRSGGTELRVPDADAETISRIAFDARIQLLQIEQADQDLEQLFFDLVGAPSSTGSHR